jgi:hypothetical protein
MDAILNFICGTCGRDSALPRVIRNANGAIVEGCVDAAHDGFTAAIAECHPDYAAHKARARAAGISGDIFADLDAAHAKRKR